MRQVSALSRLSGSGILPDITITYPEMEHLAKPLHHAMKTTLFPLFFFYQVVTKILNEDSKNPQSNGLCACKASGSHPILGYGTQCWSTTITFYHILSHFVTNCYGGTKPSICVGNSPAQNLFVFSNVLSKGYIQQQ